LDRKDLVNELENIFYDIKKTFSIEKNTLQYEGISWSQIFVLNMVNDSEKIKVSDIAEKMGVSVPAITSLTDKLIKQQLVERLRCEKDRRIVYLQCTLLGKQKIHEYRNQRKATIEKYLNGLTLEELNQLVDLYQKIRKNMN